MAKSNAASTVVLCLILVLTSMPTSKCYQKDVPVVLEEDIPVLKCQFCEEVVKQLYCQVQDKREQISPEEITEDEITKIAENTCNLEEEKADCIRKTDTVEQGDKSKLEDQVTEGICQTLKNTCDEVMDWPEILNKPDLQLDGTVHFLCENLTTVCRSKHPPFPKDRIRRDAFTCRPPKAADVEKNAVLMEGTPGAPSMNVHSADGLTSTKNPGEEDEGTHTPSKWGFWKAKESVGAAVEGSKKNSGTGKSEL